MLPHICLIVLLSMSSHRTRIGVASYYGEEQQGQLMANGRPFDYHLMTAASYDYPLGTRLKVTNLKNGKSVKVTITDRGPNHRLHRLIDLSMSSANRIGYVHDGLASVVVKVIQ